MKIFQTKSILFTLATAMVVLTSLPILQSCSKDETNELYSQNEIAGINQLKKDFGLKECNVSKSKSIIRFTDIDSARMFLSRLNHKIIVTSKTQDKFRRIKSNSPESSTTSSYATVTNNAIAKICTVTTSNALGDYFPGASFVVTINYSNSSPIISDASLSGFNWGWEFNRSGSNVTYSTGRFNYGIVGKICWTIEVLGKTMTYSQNCSITGWANKTNLTGFSTCTVTE